MLRRYLRGVLNVINARVHNALVEAKNSRIQVGEKDGLRVSRQEALSNGYPLSSRRPKPHAQKARKTTLLGPYEFRKSHQRALSLLRSHPEEIRTKTLSPRIHG